MFNICSIAKGLIRKALPFRGRGLLLLTGLLFCTTLVSFSQSQISKTEYYIDTDPGVGNGISRTFALADSVIDTISIATGSLSPGFHRVYIRYFNDSGKWGTTANALFYVMNSTSGAAASSPSIVNGEYFVDTDPGTGNGTAFTSSGEDSSTNNLSIATASLTPGYHRAYFRYRDSLGKWGNTGNALFSVINSLSGAGASAPSIANGEYFVDTDPGTGNGTAFTSSGEDSSLNNLSIPTMSLASGYHRAYIRYRDSLGKWGITTNALFSVINSLSGAGASAPSIANGEYFVDTDPGTGNGTAFTSSGEDSSTNNLSIATTSLTSGYHRAYIRYRDSLGKWGITTNVLFSVINSLSGVGASAPSIVKGEYFVDTDPGTGNGTAFTSSGEDSSTNNLSIPTTSLAPGYHRAYIRYRDSLGKWGITTNALFYVMNPLVTGAGASSPSIVSGEYFVDTDPGVGNGTPFTSSGRDSSSNLVSVATGGLAIGGHTAFTRYRDSLGKWGQTDASVFYVCMPPPGPITGPSTISPGGTIGLSDTSAGSSHSWSSGNTTVATVGSTGVVTGVADGTAIISYTVSIACGTVIVIADVSVNPLVISDTVIGTSSLCAGATISLTDAASGGTWSSSNTAAATVNNSGTVMGVAAGSAIISYNTASSTNTLTITVNPLPNAGAIAGSLTVCAGNTTTLTETTSGGTWSSSNTAIATVGSTGVITGITTGAAAVSYAVANTCGTATTTHAFAVNPLPNAGTITGSLTVCTGNTATLTDAISGGAWSSSNTSEATVNSTGIVTALTTGIDHIIYTVANSCGTTADTVTITVNLFPSAGTITGLLILCSGNTTTLTDATTGGTWSSSNTSVASVGTAGIVTGITAGIDTIGYSITNACGTATDTAIFTINTSPAAISGPMTVCADSAISLSDIGTGTWSSSATGIATVDPVSGSVTGVSAGTTTISYSTGVGCNTAAVVTVNPAVTVGMITGAPMICMVASSAFTDATTGGVWSSSNTGIATVSTLGMVTGVTAGTATISYTITGSCNTAVAIAIVTINPLPISGTITGSSVVCVTMSISLTDAASPGTWSSSATGVATVSSAGVVGAITAGTTIISYSVTNTCGTSVASKTVTVSPAPSAGTISGSSTVCVAATEMLTDPAGGVWSSSATGVAIVGSSTGIITGLSAGTSSIFYNVTVSCGAAEVTKVVTVNPLPNAGIIGSTPLVVCAGMVFPLTETVTDGVWSSSEPSIATVGFLTGTVTSIAGGTTVLNYTVTNTCGTSVAHDTITINALPFAGSIIGSAAVCTGSSITLTDMATGGVWSGSGLAASISGGIVTGLTPGVDTVKYAVTNICGVAVAERTIIVNSLPLVQTVTGGGSYCSGNADLHVGLSGSERGVFYQLLLSAIPLGVPITGTGAGLDFGIEPTAGVYTVLATNAVSECINEMADSATIVVVTITTPAISITARPGRFLGVGQSDTLTAIVTGGGSAPTYQWYINSEAISGAVTNVFINSLYFDGDSVSCRVMSSELCGTSAAADVIITIGNVGVNSVNTQQKFIVFPNPNNGVFTADLSSNTDEEVHIVVTNIVGEKVNEATTIANKATEIRLPGAAAGVYFVSAFAASGNYVVKVVFTE